MTDRAKRESGEELAPTSTNDERDALAEAAYPSAPFYVTGTNPWPQSFRDAFNKGWAARDRGRGDITDAMLDAATAAYEYESEIASVPAMRAALEAALRVQEQS